MSAPSRDFMVQQAVLNAVEYWRPFYSRSWLKSWGPHARGLPPKFHDRILDEFRILRARYGA